MKKLLIATTNPGKLLEIKKCLADLPLKLLSLTDLKINQKPSENCPTFLENAKHKAQFYGEISGLPTIADDGGLEIDILNGEPGVKSRRWIEGKDVTDEELISYTLQKLKGVPLEKRGAQLRTVLALVLPNGKIYTSEGKVRGMIAQKPHPGRIAGFPFRSLLFLPEIDKFYHKDDLTPEENLKYNHRVRALQKFKRIITKEIL